MKSKPLKKFKAYAVFDCDTPTTGFSDMYARKEPLLIFLDRGVALARQHNIVGRLREVEIIVKRQVKE